MLEQTWRVKRANDWSKIQRKRWPRVDVETKRIWNRL